MPTWRRWVQSVVGGGWVLGLEISQVAALGAQRFRFDIMIRRRRSRQVRASSPPSASGPLLQCTISHPRGLMITASEWEIDLIRRRRRGFKLLTPRPKHRIVVVVVVVIEDHSTFLHLRDHCVFFNDRQPYYFFLFPQHG